MYEKTKFGGQETALILEDADGELTTHAIYGPLLQVLTELT